MTDLYADLGLDDATGRLLTAEEIHDAYKRRAKHVHPDMPGGTTEAFQKAEAAYAVLGDEEARAYYHATGRGPETANDPILNEAVHAIGIALGQVIERASVNQIDNADLTGWMGAILRDSKARGEKHILTCHEQLAKAETMNGRWRQHGKATAVVQMLLDKRVTDLKNQIATATHLLGVFDRAIAIVASTDYQRTLRIQTNIMGGGLGTLGPGAFGITSGIIP